MPAWVESAGEVTGATIGGAPGLGVAAHTLTTASRGLVTGHHLMVVGFTPWAGPSGPDTAISRRSVGPVACRSSQHTPLEVPSPAGSACARRVPGHGERAWYPEEESLA